MSNPIRSVWGLLGEQGECLLVWCLGLRRGWCDGCFCHCITRLMVPLPLFPAIFLSDKASSRNTAQWTPRCVYETCSEDLLLQRFWKNRRRMRMIRQGLVDNPPLKEKEIQHLCVLHVCRGSSGCCCLPGSLKHNRYASERLCPRGIQLTRWHNVLSLGETEAGEMCLLLIQLKWTLSLNYYGYHHIFLEMKSLICSWITTVHRKIS